jgi:hypothetical protein
MNAVIQTLLKLQSLEFADPSDPAAAPEVAALRAQVPPQILGHYERLRLRGKKSVALIRNQACTGCYMRQPIGKINTLMRDEDIQLCDSCGRYLYLPTEPEAAFVEQPIASKPVVAPKTPKTRKRKAPLVTTA